MKVILCEDVDNLGPMGDIVNVARGYARNYLLPRRLAVVADSASAKQIEHEMRIIKKREGKQRAVYQGHIKSFEGISVEMTAKAGAEGKLYGSITSLHIAAKLVEMGHDVDRRKLVLDEPIRSLGEHTVRLRLMKDVEADIRIVVTADSTVEEVVVDDFVDLEEGGTAAERPGKNVNVARKHLKLKYPPQTRPKKRRLTRKRPKKRRPLRNRPMNLRPPKNPHPAKSSPTQVLTNGLDPCLRSGPFLRTMVSHPQYNPLSRGISLDTWGSCFTWRHNAIHNLYSIGCLRRIWMRNGPSSGRCC